MSNYHITQEQAEALWDKVSLSLSKGQCMQQAYANAVLDQVLGEPRYFHVFPDGILFEVDANGFEAAKGTKLYAPKEQS